MRDLTNIDIVTYGLSVAVPTDVIQDALADVAAFVRGSVKGEAGIARDGRLDREQQLGRFDEKARARSVLARAIEMIVDAVGEIAFVGAKPRADVRLGLVGHARDDHDARGNQSPRGLQGGDASW